MNFSYVSSSYLALVDVRAADLRWNDEILILKINRNSCTRVCVSYRNASRKHCATLELCFNNTKRRFLLLATITMSAYFYTMTLGDKSSVRNNNWNLRLFCASSRRLKQTKLSCWILCSYSFVMKVYIFSWPNESIVSWFWRTGILRQAPVYIMVYVTDSLRKRHYG